MLMEPKTIPLSDETICGAQVPNPFNRYNIWFHRMLLQLKLSAIWLYTWSNFKYAVTSGY